MNWQLLWFVLAGLVLGFALSTLWEWLYFRRERMIVRDERIAELENQLNVYEQRDREQAAASSHWPAPVYQRPGVLLESEQIEEPADLVSEDGLSEFSESVLPVDDGTADLEVAELESGESETEQFEGATAEADEDKLSEPETMRQAAVVGAAVAAALATVAALDGDETEDSEPADPLPESPQTPPYFVPSDAHTDDDELRLPRVENPPLEAALAAGVVAATGDRLEEKAPEPEGESVAEIPGDLSSARMDDSGSAPAEEEPVDELAAAVSEDSVMLADESNVETVDESIELHADDQSVATSEEEPADDLSSGLIDDEDAEPTTDVIPAEAEDELLTDVTLPEDEDKDEEEFDESNVARAAALIAAGAGRAGDEPSDRQDDEWTDESATEDAAESVAVADGVSGSEPTDEQAPEVADGPVKAVETPPAEETAVSSEEARDLLVDEIGPGFLPLRVDDLVSLDVPADPALGQRSNLPGVSPSEPIDATAVEPEPVAASPQPSAWKPEEIRGHPDNLSRVKGIGKVYRRRLYDAGIFTWHQLGQMSEEEIREIVNPFVSADVEEWPERARILAERNGRIGAQYVGPPPDDLTEIQGIGSYAMQRLYKNGIWSFRQLAAISPEELEAIIPISPSGGVIDHQRWIDIAGQLSQQHDK